MNMTTFTCNKIDSTTTNPTVHAPTQRATEAGIMSTLLSGAPSQQVPTSWFDCWQRFIINWGRGGDYSMMAKPIL